jgi:hypothetical protein
MSKFFDHIPTLEIQGIFRNGQLKKISLLNFEKFSKLRSHSLLKQQR